MTGTPLDLTPFGIVLTGLGWLYWAVALGLFVLALRVPRKPLRKVAWSLLVVAVFGLIPALEAKNAYMRRARLSEAQAHFEMRCKSAGEKITQTVDNVEGVVWMKWRPLGRNYSAQFDLDDPFGQDCGGEECIERLLRITEGAHLDPMKKEPRHTGYRFVESKSPKEGITRRYTLRLYRPFDRDPRLSQDYVATELLATPIERTTVQYGVTWDDLSTREDRERWIAGGSLKVIDLASNEVVGERLGFMMDRGQGDRTGGRSPWAFAEQLACPPFAPIADTDHRRSRGGENSRFVFRLLKPTQE